MLININKKTNKISYIPKETIDKIKFLKVKIILYNHLIISKKLMVPKTREKLLKGLIDREIGEIYGNKHNLLYDFEILKSYPKSMFINIYCISNNIENYLKKKNIRIENILPIQFAIINFLRKKIYISKGVVIAKFQNKIYCIYLYENKLLISSIYDSITEDILINEMIKILCHKAVTEYPELELDKVSQVYLINLLSVRELIDFTLIEKYNLDEKELYAYV